MGQIPIRILRVDSDTRFTDLMNLHLERSQWKVYTDTARSHDEALEKLEENSYDAVISEYDIGDKNAIQLLENVREEYDIPFIIHSRFYSPLLEEEAEKRDVTAFQKKKDNDQYYLDLLKKIDKHTEKKENVDIDFRPDIVCVYDWSGQLRRCNDAFKESIDGDIESKGVFEVFEDKKESEIREIMMDAASSENIRTEAAVRTNTGLVNYDIKVTKAHEKPETCIGITGVSREELRFIEPRKIEMQEVKSEDLTEIKS